MSFIKNLNASDLQETLAFLLQQTGLTPDDVQKHMENKKRTEILAQHKFNIFQSPSDGRWRTYVITTEGKRKMIAKKSREMLENAIVDHYQQLELNAEESHVTIKALFEEWKKYKQLHGASSSYMKRIESDWKNHYLGEEIIEIPIKELTKLQLDIWVHSLIQKLHASKKQYYNISIILRQILNYAVDKGIIEANPLEQVKIDSRQVFEPVKKKESNTQVFSRKEVKALYEEAWVAFREGHNPKHPLTMLAVMLMFQVGCRIGEIICLRFSDIERGELCIQRMYRYQQKEILAYTKGRNACRYVILTKEALNLIEAARQYKKDHGLSTDGYIFSTNSEPLSYYSVRKAFTYLCKKIDCVNKSSHKARKTFVTALIDGNVNINQVREMVGHASEQTTYSSYIYTRETTEENKKLIEEALS